MVKLNEIADELSRVWPYYTNEELCQHYDVCSNTLWRWKEKLNLPNKIVGRPNLEVRFKNNNYGLNINDQVICMQDDDIIFGTIKGFKEDLAEVNTGKDTIFVECIKCKREANIEE